MALPVPQQQGAAGVAFLVVGVRRFRHGTTLSWSMADHLDGAGGVIASTDGAIGEQPDRETDGAGDHRHAPARL